MLDGVSKDNIINTKLKKSKLKKLINDYRTKTVFSFNNIVYKEKDVAFMVNFS